ncbi:MAG: hypothetical protein OSJ58_03730, partial [Dysosmobacter sp.]|nr:hypothetical protein [Dysosmobacter sp.]
WKRLEVGKESVTQSGAEKSAPDCYEFRLPGYQVLTGCFKNGRIPKRRILFRHFALSFLPGVSLPSKVCLEWQIEWPHLKIHTL